MISRLGRVLLAITALPAEPQTVKDQPLLDYIQTRLVSGDELVQRKENHLMRPTDKCLRFS